VCTKKDNHKRRNTKHRDKEVTFGHWDWTIILLLLINNQQPISSCCCLSFFGFCFLSSSGRTSFVFCLRLVTPLDRPSF
jgi:hypothetical protein